MAIFKSLLEKAMLRLGSRGSVPAEAYVDVTTDTYVAPADGMAYLQGSNDYIVIQVTNGATNYGTMSPNTGFSRVHVPVKKGLSILFDAGVGATNVSKRFYYSVGGALKLLRSVLDGGRTLCLQLSNLLTRQLGRGVDSRCLTEHGLLKFLLQAERLRNTYHRVTDSFEGTAQAARTSRWIQAFTWAFKGVSTEWLSLRRALKAFNATSYSLEQIPFLSSIPFSAKLNGKREVSYG